VSERGICSYGVFFSLADFLMWNDQRHQVWGAQPDSVCVSKDRVFRESIGQECANFLVWHGMAPKPQRCDLLLEDISSDDRSIAPF
jgi:hypothetical protein